MKEILNLIFSNATQLTSVIAIISILVEITPIKINPLSFIFRKIGEAFNSDVNTKVDTLAKKLDALDGYVKTNRRTELRCQISNFASDLRHNVPKSESQFIAIIELCDEYLANKWNSRIKLDAEFIKSEYLRLGYKVKNHEIYIKEEKEGI